MLCNEKTIAFVLSQPKYITWVLIMRKHWSRPDNWLVIFKNVKTMKIPGMTARCNT